jgi:fumarate reductase subunit D
MATRTRRRVAADSDELGLLARAGFFARGVMYIVIGWTALLIAFGKTDEQADRTTALHDLSGTPLGALALWLLVIGFFGMALWRLSEGVFGGHGRKPASRLMSLGRAGIYAVLGYSVLKYALGEGSPQSGNQQAVDLTTTLMHRDGGRAVVVIVGLVMIAGGLYMGYQAWRKSFLRELRLSRISASTRRAIEWLGRAGGVARGVVFVTAGVFLVVAADHAQPDRAEGLDSSLRALATTPFGPLVLVLVAIGLVMFGLFSCCEARWRRF